MVSTVSVEQLSVNALRTLSIDMIEKANSGHPGLPMGAAPMAYVLWTEFMKHNPKNPKWFNRDRFVLSAGHGSALLYSLLHLSGYHVTIDDLKTSVNWVQKHRGIRKSIIRTVLKRQPVHWVKGYQWQLEWQWQSVS